MNYEHDAIVAWQNNGESLAQCSKRVKYASAPYGFRPYIQLVDGTVMPLEVFLGVCVLLEQFCHEFITPLVTTLEAIEGITHGKN